MERLRKSHVSCVMYFDFSICSVGRAYEDE